MNIMQICLNFIVFIISLILFVGLGLVIGGCIILYEVNEDWETGLALLLVGTILLSFLIVLLSIGWYKKGKQGIVHQNQAEISDWSISKHVESQNGRPQFVEPHYGPPPSYSQSLYDYPSKH